MPANFNAISGIATAAGGQQIANPAVPSTIIIIRTDHASQTCVIAFNAVDFSGANSVNGIPISAETATAGQTSQGTMVVIKGYTGQVFAAASGSGVNLLVAVVECPNEYFGVERY